MSVDIQKLFNSDLPEGLAKNPDKARQIDARFRVILTGEDGGEWTVDVSGSGPSVVAGGSGSADVTITMSAEDFQKYIENPEAVGTELFFNGRMKVNGNPLLAQKFPKVLSFRVS